MNELHVKYSGQGLAVLSVVNKSRCCVLKVLITFHFYDDPVIGSSPFQGGEAKAQRS